MSKNKYISGGSGQKSGFGRTRFTQLDDTPDSYSGHAGELAVVKADESGLEFKSEPAIDEYKVKATSADPTPGFLDAKVDGTTLTAQSDSIGALGKIRVSSSDPTPDYLNSKVDGTTLTAQSDSIGATSEIRVSADDTNVGFLVHKLEAAIAIALNEDVTDPLDHKISVGVNLGTLSDQAAAGNDGRFEKVKASAADPSAGYLDAKVDGITLTAQSDSIGALGKARVSAADPSSDYLSVKITNTGDTSGITVTDQGSALGLAVRAGGQTIEVADNLQLEVKADSLTPGKVAPEYIDGDPSYTCLRSLGTLSDQAAAGNHTHVFTQLTDVPDSYSGHAGEVAVVKGDESGIEFKAEPVIDDHKVLASAADPTPGYLDAKVDGTTLTAQSDSIGATGKIRVSADDTNAGFLVHKLEAAIAIALNEDVTDPLDHKISVGVNLGTLSDQAAAGNDGRFEKAKVSGTDSTAQYLFDKIKEGTAVDITIQSAGGVENLVVETVLGTQSDQAAAGNHTHAFTQLTDVPDSYSGHAGEVAVVKGDESGIEFKAEPVIDDHKVLASAADPTPGYLDAKVDGTMLTAQSDSIGATGKMRVSAGDTTAGFLVAKLEAAIAASVTEDVSDPSDHKISIGVNLGTQSDQAAAGDHTHAQLHDRSHALDSTSDHTIGSLTNNYLVKNNGSALVNASNTDAEVSDAVSRVHDRLHYLTSQSDHLSAVTPGTIMQGDANGLPIDASVTDAQVSNAVAKAHDAVTVDYPLLQTDQHLAIDTSAVDDHKVMASAADPTPGYLDAKVDGTTLTAQSDSIGATSQVRVSADDTTVGFLVRKLEAAIAIALGEDVTDPSDHKISIGVNLGTLSDQAAAGNDSRFEKVKASATDPSAGYLDAKVDGTTLTAQSDSIGALGKARVSSGDAAPDYLSVKITNTGDTSGMTVTDQGSALGLAVRAGGQTIEVADNLQLEVKDESLTSAKMHPDYVDGGPAYASLRTLGTLSDQACAGDDSRLSDSRTPTAHAIDGALHTIGGLTNTYLVKNDGSKLVNATNTDADVADAVTKRHAQLHYLTSQSDHQSAVSTGYHYQADGNGLPIQATNTDTDVADAVTKKHAASGQFNQATSGEIAGLTNKATPTTSDYLLIEDAAATNAKKQITIGSLPAASPGGSAGGDLSGSYPNPTAKQSSVAFAFTGIISPTALSGNTNDWAPTGLSGANVVRASASAAYNLTGLTGGADGRIILLKNVGSYTITLVNESASSTAANRFTLLNDISMVPNKGAFLQYDGVTSRWRIISSPLPDWLYGTGDPPSATGKVDGTLYFKYTS